MCRTEKPRNGSNGSNKLGVGAHRDEGRQEDDKTSSFSRREPGSKERRSKRSYQEPQRSESTNRSKFCSNSTTYSFSAYERGSGELSGASNLNNTVEEQKQGTRSYNSTATATTTTDGGTINIDCSTRTNYSIIYDPIGGGGRGEEEEDEEEDIIEVVKTPGIAMSLADLPTDEEEEEEEVQEESMEGRDSEVRGEPQKSAKEAKKRARQDSKSPPNQSQTKKKPAKF